MDEVKMEKPWDMLQIKEKGMSMGEFDNLEERLMESLVSVKLSVKEILGRLQTAGENWKGIAHHWRSESDAQEKEIEMLRSLVIQMTDTAAKLDPVKSEDEDAVGYSGTVNGMVSVIERNYGRKER